MIIALAMKEVESSRQADRVRRLEKCADKAPLWLAISVWEHVIHIRASDSRKDAAWHIVVVDIGLDLSVQWTI